MGALYKTRLYDNSGKLLAVLENSTGEREHRRFNQAGDIQLSLLASDPKAKFLALATRFEIWRRGQRISSGTITRRDVSGDPWTLFGLTNETLLAGIQTPGNVEINGGVSLLSDSADLAHIFEALTYDYKVLSLNRSFDTSYVAGLTDTGTISFELEDQVALKLDAENTYPAVNLGDTAGCVCFQFSIPEGYELFRLRWQQQVAETNQIVFRYRTSVNGGNSWTVWSSWIGHGDSQETSAAQGYPLVHPVGTDTVQIQFQLTNADTETVTEGYDDAGEEIVIYGTTPILEAVELVCRQEAALRAVTPHDTDWPQTATVTVTDVQLHYHNCLQAMVEVAEKFGYEFFVDDDCKLHLGKQLGVDRSSEIIFRAGRNMNIVQLEDSRHEMCNILTCLGAGDSLHQLRTVVVNSESVAEYGPHPDKMEWKDIETLEELEAKGREIVGTNLADPGERGAPKQTFRIQGVVHGDLPPFYLGDMVRIIIPKDGVNTTGRILEVVRGPSERGDTVDIMINRTRESAVDRIVQAIERIPTPKPAESKKPAPPSNVRATGGYRRIVVQWQARADVLSRVYHSVTKDGPYRIAYQGPDRKWIHEPLEVGETHHYKVSVVVDGVESDMVGPVKATVPGVPRGDLDQTPPGNVAWDTCEFLREIILRWFPTALAAEYEIRSVDDDWGETEGCVWRGNATTITLRPTQRTHTYYIRAISAAGVYSLEATRITLTNATPGTPPPPEVMEFFSALRIAIRPVSDDDIESYTLYMTPCDAQGDPVGETLAIPVGFAPVTYQASPGCRFRIEVAARDVLGEGGKSAPIYASTNALDKLDIPEDIIEPSHLTEELRQDISAGVGAADQLDEFEGRIVEVEQIVDEQNGAITSLVGTVEQVGESVAQHTSQIQQLSNEITLKVQRRQDGKLVIAGIGVAVDETGQSEVAMLADRFRILTSTDGEMKSVFAVDTVTGKVYILGDLIAEGLIRATEIQAELAKHLLLQAELVTADQADVLWLRADRISVGGQAPGIALMKPEGARLWHFDGSLVSTDGISPVGTPVATLRPDGRFGSAVAVEVGTTNLVNDPVNWKASSSQYQTTTVTDETFLGCVVSETVKLITDTPPSIVGTVTLQPGETYTASIYVKLFDLNGDSAARLIFYDGGILASKSADSSVLGEWQRISVTYTNNTGAAISPYVYYYPSKAAGVVTRQAAPQIEKLPYATSFTVGTRAAGRLSYPKSLIAGLNALTVAAWTSGPPYWVSGHKYLVAAQTSGTSPHGDVFALQQSGSNNNIRLWVRNDANSSVENVIYNNVWDGNWHLIVGVINKSPEPGRQPIELYVDGELVASSSNVNAVPDLSTIDETWGVQVGNWRGGMPWNGLIDELLVAPFAATPEQIAAWYNMGAPFVDPDSAINADAAPITAASGQVDIDQHGIVVRNGSLLFVDGTFIQEGDRLVTAAVERPITTDPAGDKTALGPVEIRSSTGLTVWKGRANIWADTGVDDKRYMHDGRVTNEGIIEMESGKLRGTVPDVNLPSHLIRSALGLSGAVIYWGEVTVQAASYVQITFSTAMPYAPRVWLIDQVVPGAGGGWWWYEQSLMDTDVFWHEALSRGTHANNARVAIRRWPTTTGFRIFNKGDTAVTVIWWAFCASGEPGSSSCPACQTTCQTDCQKGCQETCMLTCQYECESSCQTLCQTGCQTTCMKSCQIPPPLIQWT